MTERLAQLCALGYDNTTVIGILREEFQDIEVNSLDKDQVTDFIRTNKELIAQMKEELRGIIHEEILVHSREIIQIVAKGENKTVVSLARKLDQLNKNVEDIDLSDVDEDTFKPKHMAVFLQNLEAIERIMKMIGKYAGTDALRDLTTYRQKEMISAEIKGGEGLIPGSTMKSAGGNTIAPKPKVED